MIPPRGHRQEFTTSFSRLHVIRNWILHMWRSGPVDRLPRNILPTTSPTSYYFQRDPNLLTRLSISDQLITQVRAAAMPLLSQSPDYSPLKTESWNRSNLDMKTVQTRMYSSRMRTGRSLTVCWSLLPGGGGLVWVRGWGWYPSMHWGRHPPVDRITDACKNITLAQLRCVR